MTAYYNEFDPKAAAWLRQLIKNGVIAPGEVDERSIIDVSADDLAGFTQHHFFAGIGVWSYALRSAGWSDDSPVCTASLPCQPFSAAGKRLGKDDERHLLPHFLDLVSQCGFNTIFGEQVESAIRHGWLDDLHTEMEAQGCAVGHAVLGAHSAGGFHQRQRLYWVAQRLGNTDGLQQQGKCRSWKKGITKPGEVSGLGNAIGGRRQQQPHGIPGNGSGVEQTERQQVITSEASSDASEHSKARGLANAISNEKYEKQQRPSEDEGKRGSDLNGICSVDNPAEIDWIYCRDNKYRPIKSGLKPLVDGSAEGMGYSGDPSQSIDADYSSEARVMRLKGYGNAIHAGTAQMFIDAFMESLPDI